MTTIERREARQKVAAIVEKMNSFTQPNRNTIINFANNIAARPELIDCFEITVADPIAANAAANPVVVAVAGSPIGTTYFYQVELQ